MPIQYTKLDSVIELLAKLGRLFKDSLNDAWYRGHGDAAWKLQPTVHREYSKAQENDLAVLFRSQAPSRHAKCPAETDFAHWLPLMRHYGLPTRLLDWTASPLAAIYFAVEHELRPGEKSSEKDAAVWLLFPGNLNSKTRQGSPNIPLLNSGDVFPLVSQAFNRNSFPPTSDTFAVHATDIDLRMAMQVGAFTIHGDATPLEDHEAAQTALIKLTITASAKENMRRELKLLGIRRANLFPDLGNLAMDISSARWHRRFEEQLPLPIKEDAP